MHLQCPKCRTVAALGEPYTHDDRWFARCSVCAQEIKLLSPIRDEFYGYYVFVAPGQAPIASGVTLTT